MRNLLPIQSAAGLLFSVVAIHLGMAQPAITSVYPPVLTEQAGDHVAFRVSATGTGVLKYQWNHDGNALQNQTNAWIVLTNIQPATSGQYGVTVTDDSATSASNSVTLNVTTNYLPLFPTNLVVLRLGDGVQTLTASNGNTIYLDQYTTNGTYFSTIQIPDNLPSQPYGVGTNKTVYGSSALILPAVGADAINQGVLTLSGDQQFITLAGYQLAYPFTGTDVTAGGAAVVRGIYDVNAYGYRSLAYTNFGLYSGGPHTIRSAWTSDNTNFWTTGQAGSAGGVKYVNKTVSSYAAGSGVPTITSSFAGPRVVQAFNGNLIFSDPAATGGSGLYIANGLPKPPSGATTNAAQLALTEGGLPNDFALSPDGNTVYIADGRAYVDNNTQAGGIERWDWNGSGYVFSYTLPTIGTNGAQNLTVYFPSEISAWGPGVTGASLYATPAATTNNVIISVVDSGSGSTATTLVTAGSNQVLRGLRFGPSTVQNVVITGQPQDQFIPPGNNATFSVAAQGSQPLFYQWQLNGTNLAGATQSTLTVSNVQSADAGNYSAIVSNLGSSATSGDALLTIGSGAPTILFNPQSWNETVGDHLAFSVQVSGAKPIFYQWYFHAASGGSDTPITGATNNALVLPNIQTADAGTYFVTITNGYGSTNSTSATLNVATTPQSLSSNNIIVARVGDGSQTLSLATGNTVYLDQFTTNGDYVGTIQIPDQGLGQPYGFGAGTNESSSANLPAGSNPLIVAGAGSDAPYEALLTLSADQASLNFAGYVEAYPNNTADVTYPGPQTSGGFSTNNWRGIGGVSAAGYYSFIYTNAGLYSGGSHTIHSAASLEGINFWSSGLAQNNGIKFFNILDSSYANGAGVPQVTSTGPGTRIAQIINGNLVFSDAQASPPGLYTVADGGAPILAKSGLSSSSLLVNEGGSPVDFAISPDNRTIYIADDRAFGGSNVQGGGIQRWDSDGGGGYVYSYTLSTGTNAVGALGLTAYFPPGVAAWGSGVTGAILFATTADRPNNRIISVVDNGASSIAKTLRVAGANQAFAGIRFGPSVVAPGIYRNPQSTNAFAGQTISFSVATTGSNPFTYQWQLNGTNIIGATNAILTLSNLQNANAGDYSVIISNSAGSTNSVAGELTVIGLPQITSFTNLPSNQGFQLNFTGPSGYSYSLWTTTNAGLAPVRTKWTQLFSGGTFSGGTDTYTDPNGTNSSQFYILTIP